MHERIVRAIAGSFVLISIVLAVTVNLNWLFLAGFVGVNLVQSAITKWCLLSDILNWMGISQCICDSKMKSK